MNFFSWFTGIFNTEESVVALTIRDDTNYDIQPSIGVEASLLYPDVKYTSVWISIWTKSW